MDGHDIWIDEKWQAVFDFQVRDGGRTADKIIRGIGGKTLIVRGKKLQDTYSMALTPPLLGNPPKNYLIRSRETGATYRCTWQNFFLDGKIPMHTGFVVRVNLEPN